MALPAPSFGPCTSLYLGMTPPISLDQPTAAEKEATSNLKAYMRALGSYESGEMATARKQVLTTLQGLAEEWCEVLRPEKEGMRKATAAAPVATPVGAPSSCATTAANPVTVTTTSSTTTTPAASANIALESSTAKGVAATAVTASSTMSTHSRPPSPPKPVLLPFGSYRLDCHDPTSDLDLLLIIPHGKRMMKNEDRGGMERGRLELCVWVLWVLPRKKGKGYCSLV